MTKCWTTDAPTCQRHGEAKAWGDLAASSPWRFRLLLRISLAIRLLYHVQLYFRILTHQQRLSSVLELSINMKYIYLRMLLYCETILIVARAPSVVRIPVTKGDRPSAVFVFNSIDQ